MTQQLWLSSSRKPTITTLPKPDLEYIRDNIVFSSCPNHVRLTAIDMENASSPPTRLVSRWGEGRARVKFSTASYHKETGLFSQCMDMGDVLKAPSIKFIR
jgi:hypothetical protein